MRFQLQFLEAHPHYKWNQVAMREMFRIFSMSVNESGIIGLHLVTPSRIMELNRAYRHKKRPTDILSFRYAECDIGQSGLLGEIALCPDIALRRLGVPPGAQVDLHLNKLMVHSVCHLLGHDHHRYDEWRAMRTCELTLLRALGRSRKIINTSS